ncbi:MAG TPA: D-arabinono-1,4-lactone oxidase [Acidimicrobiales bacterium]|nr:D-arabinono-1,4-lactone oxidase [Acidimicrobiales bacterium]
MRVANPLRSRQLIWSNWARNQSCAPAAVHRPRSEDEIAGIVERAATAGRHVRVVGAGHSFTPLVCTDGDLVDLRDHASVLAVDPVGRTATVQAGISLAQMSRELAAHGLAFENLGDIAYQSIAGATSTATHGTGLRFGNLSSRIVGMRIVLGDGSAVEATPDVNPDLLEVARVGLGALGVVSTVTVQCVPTFNLHAVEQAEPVDEVLERWDEEITGNDHFEFFWIPGTRWALTKRNRRTDEPVMPRSRWRAFRDDYLLNNLAFDVTCRVGRRRPDLIPRVAKLMPSTGRSVYTAPSHTVFASPRLVHFYEMEYAIPREHLVEAFDRVRALVRSLGVPISFPVEVRVVAADDIPLSTAYGRETAYLAVHVYQGTSYDQYFQGVEHIMDDYGGRPHWGKLHFQDASTLAPRYPRWDDFQAMRARLDPDGRFTTPYLDRLLGPL